MHSTIGGQPVYSSVCPLLFLLLLFLFFCLHRALSCSAAQDHRRDFFAPVVRRQLQVQDPSDDRRNVDVLKGLDAMPAHKVGAGGKEQGVHRADRGVVPAQPERERALHRIASHCIASHCIASHCTLLVDSRTRASRTTSRCHSAPATHSPRPQCPRWEGSGPGASKSRGKRRGPL